MTFQPIVALRADVSGIAMSGVVEMMCAVCHSAVVVEQVMIEYVPDRLLLCEHCALPCVMERGQA